MILRLMFFVSITIFSQQILANVNEDLCLVCVENDKGGCTINSKPVIDLHALINSGLEFKIPSNIDSNVVAIECRRPSVFPYKYDYEVVKSGYDLIVQTAGHPIEKYKKVLLVFKQGRFSYRILTGQLSVQDKSALKDYVNEQNGEL